MPEPSPIPHDGDAIFHLETSPGGLATLVFDLPGRRVNLWTREALEAFGDQLEELRRRADDIGCLVFLSAKDDSFCHGVDIGLLESLGTSEGDASPEDTVERARSGARVGQDLFSAWEALPFPTVAAIAGTCVGGGTELALASTYRVASDGNSVRMGLPEVRLGILPAWGGSVRLPRRIGLSDALQLMLTGKSVDAARAQRLGLVDTLVPHSAFLSGVRDFALSVLADEVPPAHEADLREILEEKNPLGRRIVFDQARRKTLAKTGGRYPAPVRIIEVVRVGLEQGREAGFAAEDRALAELGTGSVASNLLHVFRLHQRAKKESARARREHRSHGDAPVRRAAVVGAGVMGADIAQLIAVKTDVPVRVKDIDGGAVVAAMESASRTLHNRVKRRRLSRPDARQIMTRLQPCLDYRGFSGVDLVMEAVTESLEVKRTVLRELEAVLPSRAVLATNTSSLSLEALAQGLEHPERLVGMHFFNPVHRLPLVEVVTSPATDDESLRRALAFAHDLGKTPVRVSDSPGFLVNRILSFFMTEALCLLAEGYAIDELDEALTDWGLPMGPLALIDRIGIDLAIDVVVTLRRAFPGRMSLPDWDLEAIFLKPRRLGRKSGVGYYRYDDGRRTPNAELYRLLGLGSRRRRLTDPVHVCDRVTLPMVNEAARCLAEGVVEGPEDVDLALLSGAGFPPFRGGLCRWADQQGLDEIVAVLERLAGSVGERLAPSDALRDLARRGGFYGKS